MPRRKVGEQVVLGLGLNKGRPEHLRLLDFVRGSGRSDSEMLYEALSLLAMGPAVQAQPSQVVVNSDGEASRALLALVEEFKTERESKDGLIALVAQLQEDMKNDRESHRREMEILKLAVERGGPAQGAAADPHIGGLPDRFREKPYRAPSGGLWYRPGSKK